VRKIPCVTLAGPAPSLMSGLMRDSTTRRHTAQHDGARSQGAQDPLRYPSQAINYRF
jgi:hypothetical protein